MNKSRYFKVFNKFYKSRTHRERYLFLMTTSFLIYVVWSTFLYQPTLQGIENSIQEIELKKRQLGQAQLSISNLQIAIDGLSKGEVDREAAVLQRKIKDLDERIDSFSSMIRSPEKMFSVFKDLLSSSSGVELISVKNSLPIKDNDASDLVGRDVFQHSVTVVLEGKYDALTDFIKRFEQRQPAVSTSFLSLKNDNKYPIITASLTYHLLSFKKEILIV